MGARPASPIGSAMYLGRTEDRLSTVFEDIRPKTTLPLQDHCMDDTLVVFSQE